MTPRDLIELITKACRDLDNDEIFITDNVGKYRMRHNPDICIVQIDKEDEGRVLTDLSDEEVQGNCYRIK
jgi:hypothetical protein